MSNCAVEGRTRPQRTGHPRSAKLPGDPHEQGLCLCAAFKEMPLQELRRARGLSQEALTATLHVGCPTEHIRVIALPQSVKTVLTAA